MDNKQMKTLCDQMVNEERQRANHLEAKLHDQELVIQSQKQELQRLKAWVNDLQSGMYINCVYCGFNYGPRDKVDATMDNALKKHIEQCPEHPMSQLKKELEELKNG